MNAIEFTIGSHHVGASFPTYFIADISANHDGDLERAKALIHLAAAAGADAAKFQNFQANKIVSDKGFRSLGGQQSHQANWSKSVFEVYREASVPWEWTPVLKTECDKAGVSYFSTPYDLAAVDMLEPFVPAYKVGSGDLTWPEIYMSMARKGRPVILATGASNLGEVQNAVLSILEVNQKLCVMQCNTNYTGSLENFNFIHLRVLRTYKTLFPKVIVGLSDHTPGHSTVLGAVALGARMIEKHFTDNTSRKGPDHSFSMTPNAWREMVDRTRELEAALGFPVKTVAANERETVVIQRRCIRAARDIPAEHVLLREDLEILRPSPHEAIQPYDLPFIVGRKTCKALSRHDPIEWNTIGS
jgi:sialic acid synthase SpsE